MESFNPRTPRTRRRTLGGDLSGIPRPVTGATSPTGPTGPITRPDTLDACAHEAAQDGAPFVIYRLTQDHGEKRGEDRPIFSLFVRGKEMLPDGSWRVALQGLFEESAARQVREIIESISDILKQGGF